MFALQSAPPSLGPPAVTFVVLLVVGVVVGAVGSAVARRLSNPVSKYRLLYVGVLFPYALLAYGALALLGLGGAVSAALGVGAPVATHLADFVTLLAAGVVGLGAYGPTVRGVCAVRDIDLSTATALRQMARFVVGMSVLVTVAIAPLQGGGVGPFELVGVFAVLLVVGVGGAPWLIPLIRSTTDLDSETRDRLATLRERAGLDVRDAVALDTDDAETANVHVRGPPGYRRLFVTTTFLDRFDDATATALLAIQAGHVRTHLLAARIATVILAAVPLVAAVAGARRRWLLLGAALLVTVVGFWYTRRCIRRADDVAAERVDADAVADALERYADVHGMDPSRRRVPNPLSTNVPLGDRIDRLRTRASENSVAQG
ncbi:STE24 endopeptidase [Haloplanus vescus]|uniref:STE24 endopeptidase n=1 Tax=Haloplanus vescus TaxID=555874 RepID=A0A1H4ASP6_9EURY|nr:peptidase [Haloplanus vescus]SEA38712.1 STE24 endopeptidase [Haloplanus vescus]